MRRRCSWAGSSARRALARGTVRRVRARIGQPKAMEAAIAVAFERGLTVYDAAYVVLAEALDAPLVTAERRLAEATERAVLLAHRGRPGAGLRWLSRA